MICAILCVFVIGFVVAISIAFKYKYEIIELKAWEQVDKEIIAGVNKRIECKEMRIQQLQDELLYNKSKQMEIVSRRKAQKVSCRKIVTKENIQAGFFAYASKEIISQLKRNIPNDLINIKVNDLPDGGKLIEVYITILEPIKQ